MKTLKQVNRSTNPQPIVPPIDAYRCAGCGQPVSDRAQDAGYKGLYNVFVCEHCGAVQGRIIKGDLATVVHGPLSDGDMTNARYFDLEVLSSTGVIRFHGWCDRDTGLLLQIG
jgi:hypothetical protein